MDKKNMYPQIMLPNFPLEEQQIPVGTKVTWKVYPNVNNMTQDQLELEASCLEDLGNEAKAAAFTSRAETKPTPFKFIPSTIDADTGKRRFNYVERAPFSFHYSFSDEVPLSENKKLALYNVLPAGFVLTMAQIIKVKQLVDRRLEEVIVQAEYKAKQAARYQKPAETASTVVHEKPTGSFADRQTKTIAKAPAPQATQPRQNNTPQEPKQEAEFQVVQKRPRKEKKLDVIPLPDMTDDLTEEEDEQPKKHVAKASSDIDLTPEANLDAWPSLDGRSVEIHVYKAQQQAEAFRIEEACRLLNGTQ